MTEENKEIINNEYDYSNIIPKIDYITYLFEYCDNVYNQFIKLCSDEEEKNKQFKEEFKDYLYKKGFGTDFEINIYNKNFSSIECKNINEFKSAIKNNNLKNITKLKLDFNLDYSRGKGLKLDKCTNSFSIKFEPYNIKFIRKTNTNDVNMNNIESNINNIFKKMTIVDTIFCDKSNIN